MTFVREYPPLQALLRDINHIDVKVVDVATAPSEICLREFIAGFIAYNPGWIKLLYHIRAGFVACSECARRKFRSQCCIAPPISQ
jgi:hypothetical protein